jgi:hypothetical protein
LFGSQGQVIVVMEARGFECGHPLLRVIGVDLPN